MNSDAENPYLDQVDRALQNVDGKRRESETSFLMRLLAELGHIALAGVSPAVLFRAALHDGPLMRNVQGSLRVLAMPSQRPDDALRPGDWILRSIPGTGDVGHLSVLASIDLLTTSALAAEDIATESMQPGYYGLVIEAGAFPHGRSRPFARRLLDTRGRVPPHTVVLRPKYSDPGTITDLRPGEPKPNGVQRALDNEELEWFAGRPLVEHVEGDEQSPTCFTELMADVPRGRPIVGSHGVFIRTDAEFTIADEAERHVLSLIMAGLMGEKYDIKDGAAIACEVKVAVFAAKGTRHDELEVWDTRAQQYPPVKLLAKMREHNLLRADFDDLRLRTVEHAWAVCHAWHLPTLASPTGIKSEPWFTLDLFRDYCWQQRDRVEALRALLFPKQGAQHDISAAIEALWSTFSPGIDLLRYVHRHPRQHDVQAYEILFGKTDKQGDPNARKRFLGLCAGRFRDLARDAYLNPERRLPPLLRKFLEDYWVAKQGAANDSGNRYLGTVALANLPPFLARIRTSFDEKRLSDRLPALPAGAPVQCAMVVEVEQHWDLFGSTYAWDVLRISHDADGRELESKTHFARKTSVLNAKVERQLRYSEADARESIFARDVAALRVAGTRISQVLKLATQDASDREVLLQEKGSFRIRCVWERPGAVHEHAVLRAPSIAFVDCEVVDAKEHAEAQVVPYFHKVIDVGEYLQDQLTNIEMGLTQPATAELALSPEWIKQAEKLRDDIKACIERRNEVLQKEAEGATLTPFAALIVLDDGPTVPMLVEFAQLSDGKTLVLDSTAAKGRWAAVPGQNAAAIVSALQALLNGADYGRGHCAVILRSESADRDWERHSLRIGRNGRGIFQEFLEGVSLIMSVFAVLAAPFTGGASLALLVPAGLIGVVPTAMRIADRRTQHTFDWWSLETALDVVDAASAFFGVAGKAVGTLRFVRLSAGFAIADRAFGMAGIVLGNESFFSELEKISKENLLPAEKRHRMSLLIANKLLADGIAVGARLMQHAAQHATKSVPDPLDDVLKMAHAPPGTEAAQFEAMKSALKVTRQADLERIGLPTHVQSDLDMIKRVRDLTGRDIRVVRDSRLSGATAEVRYSLDRFGFIDEVYIALGRRAGVDQIRSHAMIADHLAGYMTLFGRLRLLFMRAVALTTGDKTKDVGRSAAWEAALELRKLNEQWIDHMRAIGKKGPEDSPAWWEDYAHGLLEQMAEQEDRLRSAERGTGVIAAEDRPATRRRLIQTTIDRLKSEAPALLRVPQGQVKVDYAPGSQNHVSVRRVGPNNYEIKVPRSGELGDEALSANMEDAIRSHMALSFKQLRSAAEEAEYRGLPRAEGHYRWELRDGRLIYEGLPKQVYDPDTGTFVRELELLDIHGRATKDGISWLAKTLGKSEDEVVAGWQHRRVGEGPAGRPEGFPLSGDQFEMLVRHVHGDEAVALRSERYRVWLTKEVDLSGQRREPTLNRIASDLLATLGANKKTRDEAASILNGTVNDLVNHVPGLRRLVEEIRTGTSPEAALRKAELEEFLKGSLKLKKPDLVEFDVAKRQGTITDFTLAVDNPVHNLKTLIYRLTLERITGCRFKPYDWRSSMRSKPITFQIKTRPYTKAQRKAQQRKRNAPARR